MHPIENVSVVTMRPDVHMPSVAFNNIVRGWIISYHTSMQLQNYAFNSPVS